MTLYGLLQKYSNSLANRVQNRLAFHNPDRAVELIKEAGLPRKVEEIVLELIAEYELLEFEERIKPYISQADALGLKEMEVVAVDLHPHATWDTPTTVTDGTDRMILDLMPGDRIPVPVAYFQVQNSYDWTWAGQEFPPVRASDTIIVEGDTVVLIYDMATITFREIT